MGLRIQILFSLLFLFFNLIGYVQPSLGQEISKQEQMRQLEEKEKALKEKIEKEREIPEPILEEKPAQEILQPISTEKVFIQKIKVIDATLLTEKEIQDIVMPFENKELGFLDMQKIAELITEAYYKKGYVTSYAYLPPQKIKENILEIKVREGLMGNLEIKGNRYFKTELFQKKITLKKDQVFNYNVLKKNLVKINEHPDRTSRAVLMPGKEMGETDVVLEVKDRFPVHIELRWDNFGSRYIEKDRYQISLIHNNFLGLEDILNLRYQLAEADTYRLISLHYLFPLTDSTKVGFLGSSTKLDLAKEYKDLNVRGKSKLYSLYLNQNLIDKENINLTLNLGFDYKDIFNFQLGNETSRDRLRVIKAGFDVDISDNFGRTITTFELECGVPEIMGGLKAKDVHASRSGSGGKFVKETLNLLRLQKMPFNSTLLWKNQIQLSSYILTSAEQFQIGGVSNVRGYPSAEEVGDKGYTMSWEWSFPVYFIPKEIKIPFSKAKLYEALKVVTFYDWGNVRLHRVQAGEEKHNTLRSVGCGLRFNLPENFSLRVDLGWSLDRTPSDKKHMHPWIEVSKNF